LLPSKGEHIVDYKNLRLSERKALTAIQVLSFRDKHEAAAAAIGKALGIECSTRPGVSNSDGKTQVSWNGARQVMAKNTAIDLHPRAFTPGRCAMTSVAHMNASIVQVDDAPTYDLFVIRSMARSFAHAIEQSCREFAND
jgi:heterotetrameric sarcosine oxidase gamma subunit